MSAAAKAAVLSTGLDWIRRGGPRLRLRGAGGRRSAAAMIALTAIALTAMATACTIGERARPVR